MVCLDQTLGESNSDSSDVVYLYLFQNRPFAKLTSREDLSFVTAMFAKRSLWIGARRFLISPPCRKFLATWNVHPSIHDFTQSLTKTQPKFSLSPNKLRVLYEPEQFYKTLLVGLYFCSFFWTCWLTDT